MILDEIKKANIQALKDKDSTKRGIFSVVLNKIKLEEIRKREKGESLTDVDIVSILQKAIKELSDEKANYEKANNFEMSQKIEEQSKIIEEYLPQMMTKEEIKNVIMSFDDKTIPFVMKHFKSNFAGKCDMRLVQEVLREIWWKYLQ